MNELFKQLSAHLEFFGYSVEYSEGVLKTTHATRSFFWVYPLAGGALFRALFKLGGGATANRGLLLDFLNQANGMTVVGRYHTFQTAMAIDGWYPDSYTKKSFGAFLEQYLADIQGPAAALQSLTSQLFQSND
jgi:hypothetical protein